MNQVKKRHPTSPRRMPSDYNKSRITSLWIAGCYYNPEDPHLFVPNFAPRLFPTYGPVGLVINLGHPLGWRVMGGILMVLEGVILALSLWTHEFALLFLGAFYLFANLLVLGYVYLRILDR